MDRELGERLICVACQSRRIDLPAHELGRVSVRRGLCSATVGTHISSVLDERCREFLPWDQARSVVEQGVLDIVFGELFDEASVGRSPVLSGGKESTIPCTRGETALKDRNDQAVALRSDL